MVDSLTSERVYLDKNALSNLWRSRDVSDRTKLRLRRRLNSPLAVNAPTIVVDLILLEELSRLHENGRKREVEFIYNMPRRMMLRPLSERARFEVSSVFGGNDEEGLCLTQDESGQVLLDAMADKHLVGMAAAALERDLKIFEASELKSRQGMLRAIGSQGRLTELFSTLIAEGNLETLVVKRAREEMVELRDVLGLPTNKRSWPDPTQLPSFFARKSYETTRICLVNMKVRGEIDRNDYADSLHYAAAAHADILVTDDKAFRAIIESCPGRRPRLMKFTEWAKHVVGE